MITGYLRGLYRRTMDEAYGLAHREALAALKNGGDVLDCGAGGGHLYHSVFSAIGRERYHGVEWSQSDVATGQLDGLNIVPGDLNQPLAYRDGAFQCVIALSVVEHLLHPCRFLRECHRILAPGGKLVILTPNISTYFTAALILAGKMPSSGPHPDSDALLANEELFKVSAMQSDADSDTPSHRHLVVFSYSVLRKYLRMLGFASVNGRGFGLYPFPNFMQPFMERIDPMHCHQMVFVATKAGQNPAADFRAA